MSPGRIFAFQALEAIESEGAFSSHLFASPESQRLSSLERAFAYELVLGVLRSRSALDEIIRKHQSDRIRALQREVLNVLRLGVYQMLFMDRVPPFAAVSQSVTLCRIRIGRSPQGLVNAILRRIAEKRESWRQWLSQEGASDAASLSLRFSHPEWLVDRWRSRFGEEKTVALLRANNLAPRRDLHIPFSDSLPEADLQLLSRSGFLRNFDFPEGAYFLDPAAGLAEAGAVLSRCTPCFHFQSRASQCVPHLLPLNAGDRILDACAAPGGKTLILSKRLGPQGEILAIDRKAERFVNWGTPVAPSGRAKIVRMAADCLGPLPFRDRVFFSSVLLDAPCTGSGTVRRHPEIRWRIGSSDISRMQKIQRQLLEVLCGLVDEGGYFLYSTCSTEPEETDQVICEFLASHPEFRLQEIRGDGLNAGWVTSNGYFCTWPGAVEEDGFFAALLRRSKRGRTGTEARL